MTHIYLENDLVILRPMEQTDVAAIFAAGNDERIWTHIAYDLLSEEAALNYVKSNIQMNEKGERIVFVIIDKITNKVIGSTSIFDIHKEHARCEIGATWLAPAYWRTSINTNCKLLLLQYIFETLEFERVQIKTDNLNERSQQAIERIGAKFEGRLRNHMRRKDGTMRDTMMYSIIKEEWPDIQILLQNKVDEFEDR